LDAEVIVAGAGPAGAAAAYYLAQRGRRVLLLDRKTFPRDKSCGDGLTRSAVRLLAEMDVLPLLPKGQTVRGVRVFMRGKGSRDFGYPDGGHGLVVPRLLLDDAIRRRAVAVGAEMREGVTVLRLVYDRNAVVGLEADDEGERRILRAPVVVAADGAASRLARQAGLTHSDDEHALGFAIRGYYTSIADLSDMLEIYLPLLDATDRYLLPSYGWVFPIDADTANVGVGLFRREHDANLRELFKHFLADLQREPRFAGMRLKEGWRGAPLRFDFEPGRCAVPGLLLAGDAAGLTSPFTGEGISYALESGKEAAEIIDRALNANAGCPDLSEYAVRLGRLHAGYFEAGRESARRYVLVWHALDGTFQSDKPIFELSRQALIIPESLGASYLSSMLDDVRPHVGRLALPLRADLSAVGDVLNEAVRRDWPFLAHLWASGRDDPGVPFRPATLLLLAAYLSAPLNPHAIPLAAAVELGYLATLAQVSVMEEAPNEKKLGGAQPGNWGNMFAVMVGDLLLSKAYDLSAASGSEVSRLIGEAMGTACQGRVRQLRNAHNLEADEAAQMTIVQEKTACLFELPCKLGGWLARVDPAELASLTTYGRHLAIAYQITDDIAALEGQSTPLSMATRTDLEQGLYSVPLMLALRESGRTGEHLRTLLARPSLTSDNCLAIQQILRKDVAIPKAMKLAVNHAAKAKSTLARVREGPARSAMQALADHVVTRS
jgi:geranylgeranyl reductase family protein